MPRNDFNTQYRTVGRVAAWATSSLLLLYIPTLLLGFLSLKSPQDPIGDPYFTILELLILLTAPFMVISMMTVHAYASAEDKPYSLAALIFMILAAGITSSVHFVIVTVSRQIEAAGFSWAPLFFSFKWPSVVYTLDILAWDGFFALSMLCAAPVFRKGKLERALRVCMVLSSVLSLAGLIGVPLANMNVRNIGIIGYTIVAIAVFLLMGIVFGRSNHLQDKSRSHLGKQTY